MYIIIIALIQVCDIEESLLKGFIIGGLIIYTARGGKNKYCFIVKRGIDIEDFVVIV